MKTAAIVFVVLVAAVLIVAAARPKMFRMERRTTIEAPAERAYWLIADFHCWQAWSPWEKLDPELKRTFSGRESGEGTVYAWESQGEAGAGRMEITHAAAPSRITIRLEFFRPFRATNTAEFLIEEHGSSTTVTWAMFGPQPYRGKLMGLFLNMDRLIGREFETGLANLKALAENAPAGSKS